MIAVAIIASYVVCRGAKTKNQRSKADQHLATAGGGSARD